MESCTHLGNYQHQLVPCQTGSYLPEAIASSSVVSYYSFRADFLNKFFRISFPKLGLNYIGSVSFRQVWTGPCHIRYFPRCYNHCFLPRVVSVFVGYYYVSQNRRNQRQEYATHDTTRRLTPDESLLRGRATL